MKQPEDVLELIRKCLALSKSSNEHEAARAAEKAQELLFKYNLTMAEVQTEAKAKPSDRIIRNEHMFHPRKNEGRWQIELAAHIARYNFCQILYYSNLILFIGEQVNTEVCRELFNWLTIQLQQLAFQAVRNYSGLERRPVFKRGFYQGAVYIVARRLQEQWDILRQQSVKSTALVVRNDEAVQEYIDIHFPKVRKSSSHNISSSVDGTHAGIEAGHQVDITVKKKVTQS